MHCVFHIAYYDGLLRTRTAVLEQAGYKVTSVLGNEQAQAATDTLLSGSDAALIGFSGPYQQRAAMLRWLKQQHPRLPVMVLQARAFEQFETADQVALAEPPQTWLAALNVCVKNRRPADPAGA